MSKSVFELHVWKPEDKSSGKGKTNDLAENLSSMLMRATQTSKKKRIHGDIRQHIYSQVVDDNW